MPSIASSTMLMPKIWDNTLLMTRSNYARTASDTASGGHLWRDKPEQLYVNATAGASSPARPLRQIARWWIGLLARCRLLDDTIGAYLPANFLTCPFWHRFSNCRCLAMIETGNVFRTLHFQRRMGAIGCLRLYLQRTSTTSTHCVRRSLGTSIERISLL